MYICAPFLLSLPLTSPHPTHLGHHRAPSWAPCAYSRFPLFHYFTHGNVSMSILISQFISLCPSSPMATYPFSVLCLYFCLQIGSSVPFFYILHIWVNKQYLFFSDLLHSVRQTHSPSACLPSHFSHVPLCATPWTAAYQASPSLGFSRQEHWSGLPFPSPMLESGKWKWSRSVVSNS